MIFWLCIFVFLVVIYWHVFVVPRHPSASMWRHYCEVEGDWMMVGKNCECNWCGKTKGEPHG